MIDIVPPTPVWLAFVAGAAVAPLLALLGRRPFRIAVLSLRFKLACLGAGLLWLGLLAATGSARIDEPALLDLAAGGMVLLSASLLVFTVWGLLAWGFTITMLLTIAAQERPLTGAEWQQAFAGGRGFEALVEDRLALLVDGGYLVRRGEGLELTRKGRFVGRVARLYARIHGFRRGEW